MRTNEGEGAKLPYVSHSTLWQLGVRLRNSGANYFDNLIDGNLTFVLNFTKAGEENLADSFYIEKVVNIT